MVRSIRVALCALAAIGASMFQCDPGFGGMSMPAAHADEASPNASDCMSFQNDVQEKSIVVHASNLCERKLSCSMSYVVRCEDNGGKKTSSAAGNARFALAAHGAVEVPLSAEQCKQAWTIDDVAWVCR
jgi:hypothetical protein